MALREVKDPRISEAFISVTAVDVTPDLKFAKVYYSAMTGDKKEIAKGLKAAAGFMRRELASSLNLRMTPELSFIEDESVAYGARIASILNNLEISPEEDEEEETDGENA